MKNDKVVHGYLDLLDYTKDIAQLRFIGESNKTCTFKFSRVWLEALRDYWGDKVRCLINAVACAVFGKWRNDNVYV